MNETIEKKATPQDRLMAAYRDYANSADGAGSVQTRVVQRLVEAVFDVLEPWGRPAGGVDRTPQDRLAAALRETGDGGQALAFRALRADPSIAADMALAARLRDPEDPLLHDALFEVGDYQDGAWRSSNEWAQAIRAALTEEKGEEQ